MFDFHSPRYVNNYLVIRIQIIQIYQCSELVLAPINSYLRDDTFLENKHNESQVVVMFRIWTSTSRYVKTKEVRHN